ncbi:Arc family DNA-binding protein [Pseudomonas aeruginosa]|uniref:Arc family DNA-binding protein n=1 Tax=Pseudomonas aeruginosa TaxID=287 RepID=UPI0021E85549|nr:Arc family DNA-binding protein [Pseudomonas aeruginosa]MCV3851634.1 Arc family DNA-binding protein [Pseudomonas aeruginosa]MCV3857665.1 Arc family DNA-binding protein [Pseudomonas aeruginosa]
MHHGAIDSNESPFYILHVYNGDALEGAMARKDTQFNLRLPEDLKQWVEAEAQKNCRSQTAEVVFALREVQRQREQANA